MKTPLSGLLAGLLFTANLSAQIVVPATPKKFVTRPIGGGTSGGVEVLPKDGGAGQNIRYVTHIVLSPSRFWTSTDNKLLEGKLIAFEDLVVEAPKGAAAPPNPTPPETPTVVRDGKIRLLVKQKPVEVALARFSQADQEFVEQTRKAYTKKTTKEP